MEFRSLLLVLLLSSAIDSEETEALPRATVRVTPDTSVFTGETVTLECEIEDQYRSLDWRYLWYKDRTEVSNTHPYTVNTNTLTISSVTQSDQSQFRCDTEIHDRPQTSSRSSVDLTVKALPRATVRVTPDTSVFTGETVTLECEIDQYRSLDWRYLWYKDRTEVSNTHPYTVNTNTLTISSVTQSDQSQFRCDTEIHDRPQTSSRSSVDLTVKALPRATVTVTPDTSVFTGETVTLECEIEDQYRSLDWRYLWYKDRTEVYNTHPYTVNTNTLTISSVTQSDQNQFMCSGERAGRPSSSQDSDHVTLSVNVLPRATVRVTPDTPVFTGETVTLKCEIEDQYRSLDWRYLWYKGSTAVSKTHPYTVNTNTLTISSVTQSDQSQFWCDTEIHDRPQTSSSSSVDLTVKVLPRVTVRVTPDTSVFTRETVTLKCEIETQYRSLDWRYLWYKDKTEVSYTHPYTVNTNTLTIRSVTQSDQSQFRCKTERYGRPQTSSSSSVYLTVKVLPRATVSVTPDTSVFTGETVTLKCEIEEQYRSLDWRYLWYKDRSAVSNTHPYTVNTNTLTISSVTTSDQSQYWCKTERHGRPQTSQTSSAVHLTVIGSKPKAELTSDTEGSVLTGNTVTLTCLMNQFTGWKFYWYKHTQNTEKTTTDTNTYTMSNVRVSDGGQFWCRAGRGNPVYYTDYSDVLWINVTESPKAVLSVEPDKQLFSGETVTLRCEIQTKQDTEWTYSWTVKPYNMKRNFNCETQECKIRVYRHHSGEYSCMGKIKDQNSEKSDAVTLTVSSYKPKTVLRVSPQQWLTEGDSVTLMCEVNRSSTGWTFSWFTEHNLSSGYDLVSDSSGGSKGNYTVSSAALKHTGVYVCGAERGDPVYHTHNSSTQPLWITGVSSSVSLIIRPNRTQHFSSESLSLSCEDHRNSTGWTVRRYTNTLETCSSSSVRSKGTESTCTIRSLITSDTGVYWCESESGHKLHPVNISIHNGDVILDSPVHPVTEGDSLTLHCLYRDKNPSNLRAEFYKDGSVVQNQTTGDMMIISTVSKSHEGFYYCKHPERGESPKSWISVTVSSPRGLIVGVAVGLSFMFLIIVLVLVWSYRNKKGKVSESPSGVSAQQNISQTSDQKLSEDTPLQSEDSHIHDSVDSTDDKNTSTVTVSGPSDELYSQVDIKKKKRKSKDNVSAEADLTYAEIELKPKKEVKKKKEKKENNKESEDTLYSNLKMK
ncbi:hypothetical protein E1301_Tti022506 [Triplophysa tibetana]|uniref:Ig-like domain-containing protein n=1 Tax=Triplophysa tibetana TaxID=1572043 RepID=A0A5A9NA37_9TELE|nr:hypothetical protein E1301_Tti022506 [Triplophysa tibetana]